MKETEDNASSGNIYHAQELGELILLKWPYYKANYRFNVTPIEIPVPFFTELQQIIIKFA